MTGADVHKATATVSDRAKALLADPSKRIELDDFINGQVREAMAALSLEHFPATGTINKEEFAKRVSAYEAAVGDLETIVILLARWGNSEHLLLLEKILSRLAEVDKGNGGTVVWLRLGWYPLLVLMYAGGIAALSARRYDALHVILAAPVRANQAISGASERAVVLPVLTAITEIADAFKLLPGHDRDHVPRSEHLFARLRPVLDDALFLGESYETFFDRVELLLALTFADFRDPAGEGDVWGPPGRFLWKHRHSESPMALLIAEATDQGNRWAPLSTGLFGGKSERFLKVANNYKQLLDRRGGW
jgi:hypothetical protein